MDEHDCSSYCRIMPVRVFDREDADDIDNIAEMRSIEISIGEEDVSRYLAPFLRKHFDSELEANGKRVDYRYEEDRIGAMEYAELLNRIKAGETKE